MSSTRDQAMVRDISSLPAKVNEKEAGAIEREGDRVMGCGLAYVNQQFTKTYI